MARPSDESDSAAAGRFAPVRWLPWGIVLIVAFAARGAALWQFGDRLAIDRDAYREIAESVVAGHGYGFSPGQANGSPTAYRPPLYPLMLAAVTRVAAGNETLTRGAIGLLQALLGMGAAALTFLIARRLRLGAAAIIAGLLVAVDPLLVYSAALVMTETTAAFLTALLFYCGLRARTWRDWLVVGLAFGLCCLCRPTYWVFGALLAASVLMKLRRPGFYIHPISAYGKGENGETWRRCAVSALVGTALVVTPWVVRNARSMGKPILTTTHGGYTLLLGHNPIYTEEVVNRPWGTTWSIDADARWSEWLNAEMQEAEMQEQTPPIDFLQQPTPAIEVARDQWMSRRAWRYMRDEPLTAVRSSLTLLGRFWNVAPMLTTNRTLPAAVRWAIGSFYSVVFATALAGLLRIRRQEWTSWWPAMALLVSFTAVHALYWADMRMRAPLVPVIALLAARGVIGRRGAVAVGPHRSPAGGQA